MPAEDVDVVVIGLGPGGEALTAKLAGAGLAVVGVDARLVGGECPFYACVPTKAMVRAADSLAEARRAGELAGSVQVRPDWTPVATWLRDEVTSNWNDQGHVDSLVAKGARIEHGWGRITGPNEVTVGDKVFRTRRGIVLNPGSDPAIPPVDGLSDTPLWTNREAVTATAVPESLIVLGGGPVGCEFAQIFARFGAEVTIVQSNQRLLPNDEPEAAEVLADVFTREGIRVLTGTRVTGASHDGSTFHVQAGDETLTAAQVLVATGRRTDLAAIGVKAVGLPDDGRTIEVDDRMRATDGVWAIGDITGKGAFTHMSMYQAEIAAADILGEDVPQAQYHAVPHATFTDPEVAGVGLTEAAARAKGLNVNTGFTKLSDSTRGYLHKLGNDGFIKVVEDADRGVLVGATVVGPGGGEIMSALAVAVHAEVPTATLKGMILAYPTFHRAIGSALADL
ncbi:dihydrolipoyl dehydrogenase family protein [Actinocrispum wychmicini]|uniref:Pyruvate/2-oxoglutarate dehydrogenase complex dihydrolipoamide dehydrogenase (E3) component n=1 Tax=Actinocrispum wychmicini TaxID=1213861 RepID=A0A4R2JZM5_9PSEU|nr:NAD(P)/FAD-dependent oxidoreductase [Actinocrispum wychmicini]TCO64817.1 pyruvate/2-oxoglutarate dehydrogenase complex dihydrolipoamide dehydrogenase (E3) component [Actinocrispum wychmicini]